MDKFEKIRKIGEGSFGKALLVKKKDSGEMMVVKEINISKMAKKERDESRKEVAVLSQMKHPNIVSYSESFEEGGNLYIVMDYCDGGDLYKKINDQKGKAFTEDQIMDWFVQLCLAVKHVHDRKILHRDIKSQNIFLTKTGIVKLGDFGIARVLKNTVELARTCIGTPYYLSPEICENRPYNNKSDIWALGCVLYELATLKHAFEAGNMRNLVLKIIRGSFPPVSAKYSRDLRNLIDMMLRRNPRDRPSVNAVLRMPLMKSRIHKFLTDTLVSEEFSHTVLHRVPRPLPPGGVAAPKKPSVLPGAPLRQKPSVEVPPPKRYHPASVYGVAHPQAKKPPIAQAEKKKVVVKPRPKQAPYAPQQKKPISSALEAKKKEMIERERVRREQMKEQKDVLAQREKQLKMERINQAKQAAAKGWQNTISSRDTPAAVPVKPVKKEPWKDPTIKASEENIEEKRTDHHQQQQQESVLRVPAPPQPADSKPTSGVDRDDVLVEFLQRKKNAAANRARAEGLVLGEQQQKGQQQQQQRPQVHVAMGVRGVVGQQPVVRPVKMARNQAEKDYLEKLDAIRRQNYLEKKRVQQKAEMAFIPFNKPSKPAPVKPLAHPPTPKPAVSEPAVTTVESLEERRKKITALKAQAELEAAKYRKQQQKPKQPVSDKPEEKRPTSGEKRRQWGDGGPAVFKMPQKYEVTASQMEETSQDPSAQIKEDRKQWGGGGGVADFLLQQRLQTQSIAQVEMTMAPDHSQVQTPKPKGQAWEIPHSDDVTTEQSKAVLSQTHVVEDKTPLSHSEPVGQTKTQTTISSIQPPTQTTTTSTQPPTQTTTTSIQPPTQTTTTSTQPLTQTTTTSMQPTTQPKSPDEIASDKQNVSSQVKVDSGSNDSHQEGVAVGGAMSETKVVSKPPTQQVEPTAGSSPPKQVTKVSPGKGGTSESTDPVPSGPKSVSAKEVMKKMQEESQNEDTENRNGTKQIEIGITKVDKTSSGHIVENDIEISEYEAMLQEEDEDEQEVDELQEVEGLQEVEREEDVTPVELSASEVSSEGKSQEVGVNLRTGRFDIEARKLRTCSLPDLRLLFATVAIGNDSEDEHLEDTMFGDESDGEDGKGEGGGGGDGSIPVLNLVEDKSDEEEEEEDSGSEELQLLVETLQSVVDSEGEKDPQSPKEAWANRGSPQDLNESILSTVDEDEEWQDSDEECPDKTQDLGDSPSVFTRLEAKRAELETVLGFDKFLELYQQIQTFQDDEEEAKVSNVEEVKKMATTLLGPGKEEHYPALVHLVVADSVYCDANKTEDSPAEDSDSPQTKDD